MSLDMSNITKPFMFCVINIYSHDDEEHRFNTLAEAEKYTEGFRLDPHNIERLHYIDGEYHYENDWYDGYDAARKAWEIIG